MWRMKTKNSEQVGIKRAVSVRHAGNSQPACRKKTARASLVLGRLRKTLRHALDWRPVPTLRLRSKSRYCQSPGMKLSNRNAQ
jgi:hypothetical protein